VGVSEGLRAQDERVRAIVRLLQGDAADTDPALQEGVCGRNRCERVFAIDGAGDRRINRMDDRYPIK